MVGSSWVLPQSICHLFDAWGMVVGLGRGRIMWRINFWPLFSFFGVKGMLYGLRIRLDSMLLIGAKV